MISEIWAHRGASTVYPENTMPAFQEAVKLGADGIELDIQRSLDGILFVYHDENLSRLTRTNRFVQELRSDAIQSLKVKAQVKHPASQHIPRLEEVLEYFVGKPHKINIELKNSIFFYPGMEEEVVALVEKYNLENQVYYSSFNHESMAKMATLGYGKKSGLLYSSILVEDINYAKSLGVKNLHPMLNSLQKPDFVSRAHEAGMSVHTWTANEEQYIQAALSLGVNAIITDEVSKALAIRATYLNKTKEDTSHA